MKNRRYYPSLAAYNADVIAAREAYAADMAVQEGYCAACKENRLDKGHRTCRECRRAGLRSA